jgi:hypothetical protein
VDRKADLEIVTQDESVDNWKSTGYQKVVRKEVVCFALYLVV